MKEGLNIDENGNRFWYHNGLLHREDGPAVEMSDGSWEWLFHGTWHRVGGPAIQIDIGRYWYLHGLLHREDGPAIEYCDGSKRWFYKYKCIPCTSQEEFERLLKLKVFW
jgi:hypothetical protein